MTIKTNIKIYAVSLVLALPVVLTTVVNSSVFDEPLDANVKHIHEQKKPLLEDNGYVFLFGFTLPANRTPYEEGRKLVALLEEKYQQGEPAVLTAQEEGDYYQGSLLARYLAQYPNLNCRVPKNPRCFELLADDLRAQPLSAELSVYLDRFKEFATYAHFDDRGHYSFVTPLPPYNRLLEIGRLKLAHDYINKDQTAFLRELKQSMSLWMNLLEDGHSMIAKMIAVRGLWDNVNALSSVMIEHELTHADHQLISSLLQPLSDQQRDISEAYLYEYSLGIHSSSDTGQESKGLFESLLTQENVTENIFYERGVRFMTQLSKLSADGFKPRLNQFSSDVDISVFPPAIYNLAGKLTLSNDLEEYILAANYIGRIHDLNGMIQLVALQHKQLKGELVKPIDRYFVSGKRSIYYVDKQKNIVGFDCFDGLYGRCEAYF